MERPSKSHRRPFSSNIPVKPLSAQGGEVPRKIQYLTDVAPFVQAPSKPIGPRPDSVSVVHRGEKHYHDDHFFDHHGVFVDAPTLANLTARIHRGVTTGHRIGNRIHVTNVNVRIHARLLAMHPEKQFPPVPPDTLKHPTNNMLRTVIFQDRQPTEQVVTVDATQVITAHRTTGLREHPSITGFRNRDWLERYQILYDKTIPIHYADAGYIERQVEVPGVDDPVFTAPYGIPGYSEIDISLKPDLIVDYSNDIPEVILPPEPAKQGTPVRNAIYMLMMTADGTLADHAHSHVIIQGDIRLKYYDV